MLGITSKEFKRIIPLAIAMAGVAIGAYIVGLNSIAQMHRTHAQFLGTEFSNYLVSQFPNLEQTITDAHVQSPASLQISEIALPGAVYKFQIFDQQGNLKISSFAPATINGSKSDGPDSGTAVASVLETDKPQVFVRTADLNEGPNYFSQSYLPFELSNGSTAVLEIHIDETEYWPHLYDNYRSDVVKILVLFLIASLFPLALYVQRAGQLEFITRKLKKTSEYDELTGALNRSSFLTIATGLIDKTDADLSGLAMHVVDIDHFRIINEAKGTEVGDEVLKITTQRLRSILGQKERLARVGGDEFAIFQSFARLDSQRVSALAEDVIRVMSEPIQTSSGWVQVGASVGTSTWPRDGSQADDLMRTANIALQSIHGIEHGKAVAYAPQMQQERAFRHIVEARLRTALSSKQFELYYQPIVKAETRELHGFEALLRLNDDGGRPIAPAVFIPIAEELGLIGEIGAWVLEQACHVAQSWPDNLLVSVNLSPKQFQNGSVTEQVLAALKSSGLPAGRLELEVTESVLISDPEMVLSQLTEIKKIGASVALDDFGTGYSSLSYLWRFPFDKLKIDKSFIDGLTAENTKSREMLSAIIALGKVLNLQITAEGVEQECQAKELRELECDLIQGYLYGRPQPVAETARLVADQNLHSLRGTLNTSPKFGEGAPASKKRRAKSVSRSRKNAA